MVSLSLSTALKTLVAKKKHLNVNDYFVINWALCKDLSNLNFKLIILAIKTSKNLEKTSAKIKDEALDRCTFHFN